MLSQGDYAAFHTVLEGLVAAEGEGRAEGEENGGVEYDPYIRYPVELERNLMEGSYDQVWKGTMGEGVPAEEFALFSQVNMITSLLTVISVVGAAAGSFLHDVATSLLPTHRNNPY